MASKITRLDIVKANNTERELLLHLLTIAGVGFLVDKNVLTIWDEPVRIRFTPEGNITDARPTPTKKAARKAPKTARKRG